jgi:hypothetical protein
VAALVDELAVEVLDGGGGKLFLGFEVVEQPAFGDLCGGADLIERGRLVAALQQQVLGCLEQLVSGWSTWSRHAS